MDYPYSERDTAIAEINQWIADGSKIETWGSNDYSEWIILRGTDGIKEEFNIVL